MALCNIECQQNYAQVPYNGHQRYDWCKFTNKLITTHIYEKLTWPTIKLTWPQQNLHSCNKTYMAYCKTDMAYVKRTQPPPFTQNIKYKTNLKIKTIQYDYTLFTVASWCHVSRLIYNSHKNIQESCRYPFGEPKRFLKFEQSQLPCCTVLE